MLSLFAAAMLLQAAEAGVKAKDVSSVTSAVAVVAMPLSDGVANSYSTNSMLAVGPDGTFYASLLSTIVRVNRDGSYQTLHTFSAPVVDPVTGLAVNSDGYDLSQIVIGGDGNLYGGTVLGGAYGFGTLFRLTSSGVYTILYSFDHRSEAYQDASNSVFLAGPVLGPDGALYGLTTVNGLIPQLFRMTTSGSYSTLCDAALTFPFNYRDGDFLKLVAGTDGSFYGQSIAVSQSGANSSGIFKLSPSCNITQIVPSLPSVSPLTSGNDGNLYAATAGLGDSIDGDVRKITPAGVVTVLHTFSTYQFTYYHVGVWRCNGESGICNWDPGHWVSEVLPLRADGGGPTSLFRASDGNLYGRTLDGGFGSSGTLFRITSDGGFETLFELPSTVLGAIVNLAQDIDGKVIFAISNNFSIYKLSPDAPLSASASFSLSTVRVGQATTFSWSSAGATSCDIEGDVPGLSGGTAISGTRVIRFYSKHGRSPAVFSAGVRCTAADGSVSTAATNISIQ